MSDIFSLKIPSPSALGKTRHGKHRPDRYYFATWFDIEFFAKLRKFAHMQNQTIAETIRNNLNVIQNVKLNDEDRQWIEQQIQKHNHAAAQHNDPIVIPRITPDSQERGCKPSESTTRATAVNE